MSEPRLNPFLLEVPLYIAGRSIDEVKEELGLEEVIKLASNESPLGPSPLAVQAAQATLAQAHLYPGICERDLRRKLVAVLDAGIEIDNLVTGNGGSDVLRMITQAFVFDGGNTIMSAVTFPLYRILTTAFGGQPRIVDADPDYGHHLDGMLQQIDDETRIIFLCSPNNPTGQILTQAAIDDFLERVPGHVVVVFDESYNSFVSDPTHADVLNYVQSNTNVISVRSFSKSGGLANLRMGYMVGPQVLADYVRRAQLPFHSGDIALAAAAASLDDKDYHQRHLQMVREGSKFLFERLSAMGLTCLAGQANFITIVDPPIEAPDLVAALLSRGIVVRGMAPFGLPHAVRVTVGSPEDNQRFIAALGEVIENKRRTV